MDLWFNDEHTDSVKLSIKVEKQLFSGQSEEQQIDVLETKEFGKILAVDGDIMLTQKDEFIYHELLAHVPMAVNPNIKEVLVIGPNGEQLGVKAINDALTIANYAGLDLVLISPNADPAVCKIMDYNKFKYEKIKKQKEAKKKQQASITELKIISELFSKFRILTFLLELVLIYLLFLYTYN